RGGKDGYNYVCILQDKFIFSQFARSLNQPTARNIALCSTEAITWLDDMTTTPWNNLTSERTRQFDGFCKPLSGINGQGAFPLTFCDGRWFVREEEVAIEQLKQRIGRPYLIQERIRQHQKMAQLHPESVNTIRLITFNNAGRIQAFSAAQRIGTEGRSLDNWTAGGILVGVNLESGRLRETGLYKPGYGGRVTRHPQTGV